MLRSLLLVCSFFIFINLCWSSQAPGSMNPAAIAAGKRIYIEGILPNGKPLQAERFGGANLQGKDAACVNCHRRSGLGSIEGQIIIPPIIGKYLFNSYEKNVKDMSLPHVYATRVKRSPYTEKTVARALRTGIDSDGRQLNYLMPHFKLDDASVSDLIDYLVQLTNKPVPGADNVYLHFATIITPDADPKVADAMVEVMHKFIKDKNAFIRGGERPLVSTSRAIEYRVTRRWGLYVWKLHGAPNTWEKQLQDKLKKQPAFAVISGLGGKTWAPVHKFCQDAEIPCMFPNVELPVDKESDFYSMYFSKGVLLDAELIAHDIKAHLAAFKPAHIIQVYRHGDIGAAAAGDLQKRKDLTGLHFVNRELPAKGSVKALHKALTAGAHDVLVLWLRPDDVKHLSAKAARHAYLSGTMSDLENAPLPAAWRTHTEIAYPVDLPFQRRIRMYYPLSWFRIRHIKVINERVQSDTYLACGIVSEVLHSMLDSFVRDYLLERTEGMLSHRLVTGYYPRLSLAIGQRFASKGGYLVHFTQPNGKQIKADTDWVIP